MHKPLEAVSPAGDVMHNLSYNGRRGTMLPDFELFTQGRTGAISRWDYKQKQSLVIATLHDNCPRCTEYIQVLTQSSEMLESKNAVALVILKVNVAKLPSNVGSRVLFLADPQDSVRQKLEIAPEQVSLFIADQWGEIYSAHVVTDANALPETKVVEDWLTLIEIQCPECFPPEL